MKSIGSDPSVHAGEGDERIRTAEQVAATDPAYVDDLVATVRRGIPPIYERLGAHDNHPALAALDALAALARAAVARAGTEEQ